MPPDAEISTCEYDSTFITAQSFEERVKAGEALFIFANKVYKVDEFAARHPGGEIAIRHSIGHDATDEVRSFHPASVYNGMMKKFFIGEYLPESTPFSTPKNNNSSPQQEQSDNKPVPQASWSGGIGVQAYNQAISDLHDVHTQVIQLDKQQQNKLVDAATMRQKFQALEQDIRARGLFECNRYRYAKECCRYVFLIYMSLWMALRGNCYIHYLISALFMGAFWHQLVFTAHDAGHNEITGKVKTDHLIGVLIANFIGGLSLGWWKDNHNVHHIVTNDPEHDPDIQHLPFLAITTRFFNNLYSTYYNRVMEFDAAAKFFVAKQHYLYYLVLSFGRFNLHVLSFRYLLTSKNVRMPRLEWFGICVFFVWYGSLLAQFPTWGVRVMYIMVSYMVTFPLHVQITLSHFGMSTDVEEGAPFPIRQLRTTMDVDCPTWLDWFHGGLQYQVIHHLFPRMPRHNLRQCVPLVRQFCKETGLHYYMYDFTTGNGVILGAMKSVADQVSLMKDVAKYNADILVDGPNKKLN